MIRYLIVIHLIISLIYFILIFFRKGKNGFYKFIVVFTIPLFGFLYFVFLFIFKRRFYGIDREMLENMEIVDRDSDEYAVKLIDYDERIDPVPVEEALLINSNRVKRKLLTDLLKEDALSYINYLEEALLNEDTETSHYAAAAVLDIQRKFSLLLQEFSVKYEKDKTDLKVLIPYGEVLREYVNSNLLDEKNYKKYMYIYSQVLSDTINLNPEEYYYQEKINTDMELKEYEKAKYYCEEFLNKYPENESAYLLYLKYFYTMKDGSAFYKIIDKFKESGIVFSNNALTLVRFWGAEVT